MKPWAWLVGVGVAAAAALFIVPKLLTGQSQMTLRAQLPDGTFSTLPVYKVGENIVFVFTLPDALAKQVSSVQWLSTNSSIIGLVHSWDYQATGDSYYDQVGVANTQMIADTPLRIYGVATLTSGAVVKSNPITFTVTA